MKSLKGGGEKPRSGTEILKRVVEKVEGKNLNPGECRDGEKYLLYWGEKGPPDSVKTSGTKSS